MNKYNLTTNDKTSSKDFPLNTSTLYDCSTIAPKNLQENSTNFSFLLSLTFIVYLSQFWTAPLSLCFSHSFKAYLVCKFK